jgi:hypothetical protein
MEEKKRCFRSVWKVDGTSMGTEWDWSITRGIRKKRKKETPRTDKENRNDLLRYKPHKGSPIAETPVVPG